MGLAVSQIRLLALTNRKADIENQITIDSNRKMRLTRESSKLAEEYYNKLQYTHIQYATSSGYSDVTYNYFMGYTENNCISSEFWQQVATGSGDLAQKTSNTMILTDAYGKVILNNELAIAAQEADDAYTGSSTATKTCAAILSLIEDNQYDCTALSALWSQLENLIAKYKKSTVLGWMETMLKNEGYQDGGTVYIAYGSDYTASGTSFYDSSDLNSVVSLQDGYCYKVLDSKSSIQAASQLYCDGWTGLTATYAQYLGNIISYFGPMLSAAISNGSSATADLEKNKELKDCYTLSDTDGDGVNDTWTNTNTGQTGTIGDGTVLYDYYLDDDDNAAYQTATDTDSLQAGLRSGTFTLCMVDNVSKGNYHKNTTLDYFINMNYIVEKTDSSEREEITAWYNAEVADISEEETYWDTEITNLSTELESVDTEIESVNNLKDNAIKSVFDWGSS